MCNLSQGIVDDAKAEIILNMFKKGYTLEQIADVTEKSISEGEGYQGGSGQYGGEYSVAAKPSVRKNGNHLSG